LVAYSPPFWYIVSKNLATPGEWTYIGKKVHTNKTCFDDGTFFSLIGGSDFKLIYRHYATLYFVFCVDTSESELGILDLIQASETWSQSYDFDLQRQRCKFLQRHE
jgi:hypothetical protein